MNTITIQAVYRNGVLQRRQELDLPENTPVLVQVTPLPNVPQRASAQASLLHAGAFHIELDELDQLVSEIEQLRRLDLEGDA